MNTNLKKIIREEIYKFIINEGIESLSQYAQNINYLVENIGGVPSNGIDKNAQGFINEFIVYLLQIVFAVNRCVSSNNLNESFSDYGINVPPELFGNVASDFVKGYKGASSFIDSFMKKKNGKYDSDGNEHEIEAVKLSVLLQQLPRWEQTCNDYVSRYRLISHEQYITSALNEVKKLQMEYNNLVQQTP